MKKVIAILALISMMLITIVSYTGKVYATSPEDVVDSNTTGQLVQLKENQKKELSDYQDAYGSDTYGLVAFILAKVRLYSIPFGFMGIALAAIYQYIIGIRRMDTRDKGFSLMIACVTLVIICQVLPLIFTVVVKGWR